MSNSPSRNAHGQFVKDERMERLDSLGYVLVYVGNSSTHPRAHRGYVHQHVLVAEKALGRYLDSKNDVHHVNEIKSDNRPSNLVICESPKYHRLLHARLRVLKAGGDPNTDKICALCRKPKNREQAFCKSRIWYDGHGNKCRECASLSRRITTGPTNLSRRLPPKAKQEMLALINAGVTSPKEIIHRLNLQVTKQCIWYYIKKLKPSLSEEHVPSKPVGSNS